MHFIFLQELPLAAKNEVVAGDGVLHTVYLAACVNATRTPGFLIAVCNADIERMDHGSLCAVICSGNNNAALQQTCGRKLLGTIIQIN